MKCKQLHLGFEFWSQGPFPTIITVVPWAPPVSILISHTWLINWNTHIFACILSVFCFGVCFFLVFWYFFTSSKYKLWFQPPPPISISWVNMIGKTHYSPTSYKLQGRSIKETRGKVLANYLVQYCLVNHVLVEKWDAHEWIHLWIGHTEGGGHYLPQRSFWTCLCKFSLKYLQMLYFLGSTVIIW